MNRKRKSQNPRRRPKRKIAFCFLVYTTMIHREIWEKFLSEDTQNTASIYAHIKQVTNMTPDWLKRNAVRPTRTIWCGESLVFALNRMLIQALKDKRNTHFALISGADIPLYNYQKTYKKIISSPKARLDYKIVNILGEPIYKAAQWVILNRKTAQDLVRLNNKKDSRAQRFLSKMRRFYRRQGYEMHVWTEPRKLREGAHFRGCPDEYYPINWFAELYGPKNLSRYITNKTVTYTVWTDLGQSPEVLGVSETLQHLKNMRKTGAIFARKFDEEGAAIAAMKL